MTTFEHARAKLAAEMAGLWEENEQCAHFSINVTVAETGDGATISATTETGKILTAYFDFRSRIDPLTFNPEPYLAILFSTSRTIH